MVVEEMKRTKTPYVIVRGHTEDNTKNAKSYIQNLKRVYTEKEQQAYMHGEFVELNTGRVYSEFMSEKHVCKPFPIREDETIIIGQDANSGFNQSTGYVLRDGILYMISEFNVPVVGDIPRILRQKYPRNHILIVPDAASKEIMLGYLEEIAAYDIEMQMQVHNPSITERILAVNKCLRLGHMYVFSTCYKMVQCLKMRGFGDDGKPAKGRGKDALDHGADAMEYAIVHIMLHNACFKSILEAIRLIGRQDGRSLEKTAYVNLESLAG
jgi:hypothetical protein